MVYIFVDSGRVGDVIFAGIATFGIEIIKLGSTPENDRYILQARSPEGSTWNLANELVAQGDPPVTLVGMRADIWERIAAGDTYIAIDGSTLK